MTTARSDAQAAAQGSPAPGAGTILAQVRRLAAQQSDMDLRQVQPESRLREDLGMDSLDIVELQMQLEEAFALSLPDDLDASAFETVQDVAELIARSSAER
jgi:acyl carrier protein